MSAEPLNAEQPSSEEIVELTISVPADVMAALKVAAFQRRSLGEPAVPLEHLVCEALAEWLEREIDNTTSITIRV